MIVAEGGKSAGFSLYVQDGKLVYHYNWFERERTNLVSNAPVPAGKSTVTEEFAYDGGGLGKGGEVVHRHQRQGSRPRARLPIQWPAASASTRSASDRTLAPPLPTPTSLPSRSPGRSSASISNWGPAI